jgi:hypothetical protein
MIYQRAALTPAAQEDTILHVVAHISSCCSATDDPNEFAEEIKLFINPIEGKPEAVMIVGELEGHEPNASYLDITISGYDDPERNKLAKVREPVDLTPAQLQDHLIRKAGR